ncbi:uncharacterized protein [Amphiura filiformis]|uniref:uncharacterized protein n=1 Tax=Amphiura filiformis TaxID=82378 RepID=UPI003B22514B
MLHSNIMSKLNILFMTFSVVTLGIATYLVSGMIGTIAGSNGKLTVQIVTSGSVSIVLLLISAMFTHIASLRISTTHSIISTILVYLVMYAYQLKRIYTDKRLKQSWKDPRKFQERTLQKLLAENKDTEYGKRYDFGSTSSMALFRERHPLTTYEHYAGDIDRMTKGECNVILKRKPPRYGLTSGSTGKGKVIPISKESDVTLFEGIVYSMAVLRKDVFPQRSVLQKGLLFYTEPTPRVTPDGTSLGPVSRMDADKKLFCAMVYSPPLASLNETDPVVATYLDLLFSLKDRNLGYVMGRLTTAVFSALRHLEKDWHKMVYDIEHGTINSELKVSEDARTALEATMVPDKRRADELGHEFEKGFCGIMRRVWPYMHYIVAVDATGYGDILAEGYAKGIPIYSGFYSSTELPIIGYELNQGQLGGSHRYAFLLTSTVYEFIPEEDMFVQEPKTLFIDEIEVGKVYELVGSCVNGLYRFRFGDVIKVVDFLDNCPVIEFQYRSGLVLNVRAEKMDSATLHNVITKVISHWPKVTLVDYACAENCMLDGGGDQNEVNPYYVIFIEVDRDTCDQSIDEVDSAGDQGIDEVDSPRELLDISKQHLGMVDEVLCKTSFTYNSFREKAEIAPPRVYLVKPGSFDKLNEFVMNNTTASHNQFKNPRKLRSPEMVGLMMRNTIECLE